MTRALLSKVVIGTYPHRKVGTIIGRTFESEPRYDVKVEGGIIIKNVPGDVLDDLEEVADENHAALRSYFIDRRQLDRADGPAWSEQERAKRLADQPA